MTKQTIKNALEKIGVTDGQKQAEFFAAFAGKDLAAISDNDVSAVLNKLGVTDEKTLGDFFAAVREPEIMDQELDIDELDAVAGGEYCDENDEDEDHCIQQRYRRLIVDGNTNCAATVGTEECMAGSVLNLCTLNDRCAIHAVIYYKDNGKPLDVPFGTIYL